MSNGTGNVGQNIVPLTRLPVPPPATLAASGGGATWSSGVFTSGGYPGLAVAATLSQAGTLTVQRYLDPAGTIAVGTAMQQVLSAATPGYVSVRDGIPFSSFSIVLVNTGGSIGNLTGVFILQSSQ